MIWCTAIEDLRTRIDVLADNGQGNDLDIDGTVDPNSVVLVTEPIHGTLVAQGGGVFLYTPDFHFTGEDTFAYTVADDMGEVSSVATVTVDVVEANLPPLGRDDAIEMDENSTVTFNVLDDNGFGVDLDLDGSLVADSVRVVALPSAGRLVYETNGSFRYTPPEDFHGTIRFQYKIQDDDGSLAKTYEALTEELFDSGQQSRLEHTWFFDVITGDAQAFVVSGFHDSETEDFGFEYSTDGETWIPLAIQLTNATQLFEVTLPSGIRGELQVRITDSNRSVGDDVADSAYIEYMYVRSARTAHPELPQLTVSDSIITEAADGTSVAQFVVTRSGDSSQSITFAYETVDGSAEATADYAPLSLRTALLGPGVTERVITVPILDDSLPEPAETFFLQVSLPVGANIADAQGEATILANDNPPHVNSVLVGSSSWSSEFRNRALGASGGFYQIPMDADQLRTIPWEIDQIRIVFDDDVNVDVDDLVITNAAQDAIEVQSLQYTNGIATWSISPVSADRILLNLSDRITADSSGLQLDGEFDSASGAERSGDGAAGGAFHFRLNILAGDISGDGLVASADLIPLSQSFLQTSGAGLQHFRGSQRRRLRGQR